VDIPRGEVHRFDPATGNDTYIEVGEDVGAVVPRASGGMILAVRSGFLALDADDRLKRVATVNGGDERLRFNDARCDPRGRLWAGTVRDDQASGTARLYCLEPDGRVRCALKSVTISNGLDWSQDGRTLYYADSGCGTVDTFEYELDHGTLGTRRALLRFDADEGFPDGLCVDADGFVWVAVFGSWAVRRYAPDGRLDQVIEMPARDVTSLAFGGPSLDTLFVTSATERLGADERSRQPRAGAIFACRPGARGRPQRGWAG
jgi:sugar lactone lactonase YvrE